MQKRVLFACVTAALLASALFAAPGIGVVPMIHQNGFPLQVVKVGTSLTHSELTTEITLANTSSRTIRKYRLAWSLTDAANRQRHERPVLSQVHDADLQPGEVLQMTGPALAMTGNTDDELLIVGVSYVRYSDGAEWRPVTPEE